MDCPYCSQPLDDVPENSIVDSPRGLAHEECVIEYDDDEAGRRADYYHDMRYDR